MNKKELIEALKTVPDDAEIRQIGSENYAEETARLSYDKETNLIWVESTLYEGE